MPTLVEIVNFMRDFCLWFTTVEASQLGNFLTGLAAIIALIFAPFGIRLWRRQKHEEKMAEVSQSAYSRLSRFLESIRYITTPFTTSAESIGRTDNEGKRVYPFRPIFYERTMGAERNIQDFLEIWPDVEAMLPIEASNLFSKAWTHWAEIKANFETYCMLYADSAEASKAAYVHYQKSLGSEVRKNIDELKEEAKSIFRPIASFNQNTSPKSENPAPTSNKNNK